MRVTLRPCTVLGIGSHRHSNRRNLSLKSRAFPHYTDIITTILQYYKDTDRIGGIAANCSMVWFGRLTFGAYPARIRGCQKAAVPQWAAAFAKQRKNGRAATGYVVLSRSFSVSDSSFSRVSISVSIIAAMSFWSRSLQFWSRRTRRLLSLSPLSSSA